MCRISCSSRWPSTSPTIPRMVAPAAMLSASPTGCWCTTTQYPVTSRLPTPVATGSYLERQCAHYMVVPCASQGIDSWHSQQLLRPRSCLHHACRLQSIQFDYDPRDRRHASLYFAHPFLYTQHATISNSCQLATACMDSDDMPLLFSA